MMKPLLNTPMTLLSEPPFNRAATYMSLGTQSMTRRLHTNVLSFSTPLIEPHTSTTTGPVTGLRMQKELRDRCTRHSITHLHLHLKPNPSYITRSSVVSRTGSNQLHLSRRSQMSSTTSSTATPSPLTTLCNGGLKLSNSVNTPTLLPWPSISSRPVQCLLSLRGYSAAVDELYHGIVLRSPFNTLKWLSVSRAGRSTRSSMNYQSITLNWMLNTSILMTSVATTR
jgi:hypothetical protein